MNIIHEDSKNVKILNNQQEVGMQWPLKYKRNGKDNLNRLIGIIHNNL